MKTKYKFETYRDRTGHYRWRMKAGNGKVVADCGEGFKTRQARDNSLTNVMNNAMNAEVIER